MNEHHCIIDALLVHSFSHKHLKEKIEIISNGRPCPEMDSLTSRCKSLNRVFTRHFSMGQYDTHTWLTGCDKQNRLFCWSCMLFSKEKNVWTQIGFSDLNHLSSALQRHKKSQIHIESFLKYKLFSRQRIDSYIDSQQRDNINKHNELVKKNREVLKRLIDAVCFLAKQGLPLQSPNESATNTLNKGNYIEFLDALRVYDPLLDNHLNEATIFQGTSPSIQNDILFAVQAAIIDEIKRDITSATFASIMIDDTPDIMCKPQLSIVLRFVKDGITNERFVGFRKFYSNRTAENLFAYVSNFVLEFDIEDKLVGQSYDGAAVMNDHLKRLQSKVLKVYPKAIFTHCYAHTLNLILQQSLSNITECRSFFQTLTAISAFFSEFENRQTALTDFAIQKLPLVAPATWNFSTRLIYTVNEYRLILIAFFESIATNCNEWDVDSCVKSRGFLSFFSEFNSLFLLEVFSKLFSYTDELHSVLQNNAENLMHCNEKVNDTIKNLQKDRQDGFDKFWTTVKAEVENTETEFSSREVHYISMQDTYQQLLFKIIDNIIQQIDIRYGSILKLRFCELLSSHKYHIFKTNFPDELFDLLKPMYDSVFDFVKLRTELVVIYSSEEFIKLNIFELIAFLKNNELVTAFEEVYKLAELIMTIPSTRISVEHSFSALKRIHNHCKNTRSQERTDSLSVISIEKEMLLKLRHRDTFYDNVLEKLLCKEKRVELIFQ